jgi:hypothetical protein
MVPRAANPNIFTVFNEHVTAFQPKSFQKALDSHSLEHELHGSQSTFDRNRITGDKGGQV